MTLPLYIARRFVVMFALVFAAFFAVLFLVDLVEQVRRFAKVGIGLAATAELSLLNVPASIYRILPLIVILSSVALFLALARSSELVVIRAAGRSALRVVMAPLVVAFLIGGVAIGALNPIVAGTTKRFETLSNRYLLGNEAVLSVSSEGLWLRQGSAEGQTVIHAVRSNLDATELFDVSFISFGTGGAPLSRIDAAEARLTNGAWVLKDSKSWSFGGNGNPERGAVRQAETSLPSDLTSDRIRDSFGAPDTIPIWDLPSFIDGLERAGFSARRHLVWLNMELALPLLLSAMVLVGAGFTMRHARFGRTGMMVLMAIGAGFSIFLLRNFAQVLGETGKIPVILAAWTPPLAALLLAISLLLHLEDG